MRYEGFKYLAIGEIRAVLSIVFSTKFYYGTVSNLTNHKRYLKNQKSHWKTLTLTLQSQQVALKHDIL
jgi:hypothetical protein